MSVNNSKYLSRPYCSTITVYRVIEFLKNTIQCPKNRGLPTWLYRVVLLDSVRPDLWKSLSLKNWLFWQKSGLFCLQISAYTDIFAQHWVLLSTMCPDCFESIAPIACKNSHKLILLLLDYVVSLNRARQLGTVMLSI